MTAVFLFVGRFARYTFIYIFCFNIYVVYINDKIKCLFLNDNCMVMEMRDKVIFLMFGVRRINNTALK